MENILSSVVIEEELIPVTLNGINIEVLPPTPKDNKDGLVGDAKNKFNADYFSDNSSEYESAGSTKSSSTEVLNSQDMAEKAVTPNLLGNALKAMKNLFSPDKSRSKPLNASTPSAPKPENEATQDEKQADILDVSALTERLSSISLESPKLESTDDSFITSYSRVDDSFQSTCTHLDPNLSDRSDGDSDEKIANDTFVQIPLDLNLNISSNQTIDLTDNLENTILINNSPDATTEIEDLENLEIAEGDLSYVKIGDEFQSRNLSVILEASHDTIILDCKENNSVLQDAEIADEVEENLNLSEENGEVAEEKFLPDTEENLNLSKPETEQTLILSKPETEDDSNLSKPETEEDPNSSKPETEDSNLSKPETQEDLNLSQPGTEENLILSKPETEANLNLSKLVSEENVKSLKSISQETLKSSKFDITENLNFLKPEIQQNLNFTEENFEDAGENVSQESPEKIIEAEIAPEIKKEENLQIDGEIEDNFSKPEIVVNLNLSKTEIEENLAKADAERNSLLGLKFENNSPESNEANLRSSEPEFTETLNSPKSKIGGTLISSKVESEENVKSLKSITQEILTSSKSDIKENLNLSMPEIQEKINLSTSEIKENLSMPQIQDINISTPEIKENLDLSVPQIQDINLSTSEIKENLNLSQPEFEKYLNSLKPQTEVSSTLPESKRENHLTSPKSISQENFNSSESEFGEDLNLSKPESEQNLNLLKSEAEENLKSLKSDNLENLNSLNSEIVENLNLSKPEADENLNTPKSDIVENLNSPKLTAENNLISANAEIEKNLNSPKLISQENLKSSISKIVENSNFSNPETEGILNFTKPEMEGNLNLSRPEAEEIINLPKPEAEKNLISTNAESEENLKSPKSNLNSSKPETEAKLNSSKPEMEEIFNLSTAESEEQMNLSKPESEEQLNLSMPDSEEQLNLSTPEMDQTVILSKPEMEEQLNLSKPEMKEELNVSKPEMEEQLNVSKPEMKEELNVSTLEMKEELNVSTLEIVEQLNVSKPEMKEELNVSKPEMGEELNVSKPEMKEEFNVSKPEIVEQLNVSKPEMKEKLNVSKPEADGKLNASKSETDENLNVSKPETEDILNISSPKFEEISNSHKSKTKSTPKSPKSKTEKFLNSPKSEPEKTPEKFITSPTNFSSSLKIQPKELNFEIKEIASIIKEKNKNLKVSEVIENNFSSAEIQITDAESDTNSDDSNEKLRENNSTDQIEIEDPCKNLNNKLNNSPTAAAFLDSSIHSELEKFEKGPPEIKNGNQEIFKSESINSGKSTDGDFEFLSESLISGMKELRLNDSLAEKLGSPSTESETEISQLIQEQFTAGDIEKICSVVDDFPIMNVGRQIMRASLLFDRSIHEKSFEGNDLDFLENRGEGKTGRDYSRESLYVKFDPLMEPKPAKTEILLEISPPVKNFPPGKISPPAPMKNFSPGKISPPAEIFPPAEISPPVNIVAPLTPRKIIPEDNSDLKNEIKRLTQLYLDREEANNKKYNEFESQIARLTGQTCVLEDKLRESAEREKSLVRKLTEKSETIAQMKVVIREYLKTIEKSAEELNEIRKRNREEIFLLKAERDSYQTHLQNSEAAFSDVHAKYEKSKKVIEYYRENENILKDTLAEQNQLIEDHQTKASEIKEKAVRECNKLHNELEEMKSNHAQEIARVRAQLRKTELKVQALQETLDQKIKENRELTTICDDLIAGKK